MTIELRLRVKTETIGIGNAYHITEPIETISEKDYEQGVIDHPDEYTQ